MAPGADERERGGQSGLLEDAGSDGELLRRIAGEDSEAFERLYERYARPVYGLALRLLGDGADAEDATRRVFAAIARSAGTYGPESGAGARWLFAVAWKELAEAAGEPGPASASAEDVWQTFRVHAAVAALPEHERVPLELAYWRSSSRGEIADLLGLPLDTVEARTRRALERLAARLEELP